MTEPLTPEALHACHRWIQLDEIHHLPGNPNQGHPESLAASLEEFGWFDGIVVHQGVVISGNQRVAQARQNNETGLPGYDLSAYPLDAVEQTLIALTLNHTGRAGGNDPSLLAKARTMVDPSGLVSIATGLSARALPPTSRSETDGATTNQLRAGYVASPTRQIILTVSPDARDRLETLFDQLRQPGETNSDVVARVVSNA